MKRPEWQVCSNCLCMVDDECRYNPPKHGVGAGAEGRYPKVLPNDWCHAGFIPTEEAKPIAEITKGRQ